MTRIPDTECHIVTAMCGKEGESKPHNPSFSSSVTAWKDMRSSHRKLCRRPRTKEHYCTRMPIAKERVDSVETNPPNRTMMMPSLRKMRLLVSRSDTEVPEFGKT